MLSDSGGKKTKVLEPYDTFRKGLLESFAAKPSEMKKRMDKDWQREERERCDLRANRFKHSEEAGRRGGPEKAGGKQPFARAAAFCPPELLKQAPVLVEGDRFF